MTYQPIWSGICIFTGQKVTRASFQALLLISSLLFKCPLISLSRGIYSRHSPTFRFVSLMSAVRRPEHEFLGYLSFMLVMELKVTSILLVMYGSLRVFVITLMWSYLFIHSGAHFFKREKEVPGGLCVFLICGCLFGLIGPGFLKCNCFCIQLCLLSEFFLWA